MEWYSAETPVVDPKVGTMLVVSSVCVSPRVSFCAGRSRAGDRGSSTRSFVSMAVGAEVGTIGRIGHTSGSGLIGDAGRSVGRDVGHCTCSRSVLEAFS